MKRNNRATHFYAVMAVVCALMAILVLATANKNNWGGLPMQRVIAAVLAITSVAFSTYLIPEIGKNERRKKKGE